MSELDDVARARFAGLMAAVFFLASSLLLWDATHVAESEPTTVVTVTPATASAPVPAHLEDQ